MNNLPRITFHLTDIYILNVPRRTIETGEIGVKTGAKTGHFSRLGTPASGSNSPRFHARLPTSPEPDVAQDFCRVIEQIIPINLSAKFREIFCKLYTQHNTTQQKKSTTHRRPSP